MILHMRLLMYLLVFIVLLSTPLLMVPLAVFLLFVKPFSSLANKAGNLPNSLLGVVFVVPGSYADYEAIHIPGYPHPKVISCSGFRSD